jgi:hypothetical protein
MIKKKVIEQMLNRLVIIDNNDFINHYDNGVNKLKEPSLFLRAADKLLILNSLRDILNVLNEIINKTNYWDTKTKNEIYHCIDNSTMQLVFKYRKVQSDFNIKFESDAYINMKTEEWRRFVRDCNRNKTKQYFLGQLKMYRHKIIMEINLMYHDYIEKLNNWLELMESETSIDNIFNMVPD